MGRACRRPPTPGAPAPATPPATAEGVPAAWGPPVTASSWVIAGLPLVLLVAAGIVPVLLIGVLGAAASLLVPVAILAVWVAAAVLALVDRSRLRARGFLRAPSPAWALLPTPLPYLGLRAHRVRLAGRRSVGPVVLGSVATALCTLLVLAPLAVALPTRVHHGNYGAYDETGTALSGRVPVRHDVSQYVATREGLSFGRLVNADCGFGPMVGPVVLRCAISPPDSSVPDRIARVRIGADLAVVGYRIGPLDPRTDPRVRPTIDGAGPGKVPMERIVLTVAAPGFSASGSTDPRTEYSETRVAAFAELNLRAAGLEWTPSEGCASENPVVPGDPLTSGCGFVDAAGDYWEVDYDIDDAHVVHLFAEAD